MKRTLETPPGDRRPGWRILCVLDQPANQSEDRPIEQPSGVRLVGGDSAEGSSIEPKPSAAPSDESLRPGVIPGSSPGAIVGRRYEIVERLGSGRRGTVLLARDRLTDARVAVKRLRTDETLREAVELALRAAEVQATLRHPNIVRVFDVGEDSSGPYIVSEYIDGPDLAQLVTTQGAMDLGKAIQTVGIIGEAMTTAHEAGLFHGSIRGSNVLMGPNGAIKVADFSVAGIDPGDEPRARRQDVRGLARTLCQLLTGVSRGTINVHELPRPIRPVIRHAMGRSVASRQSTMELFLRELRASELEPDGGVLSEGDAIRRGRAAELSGSFAAMREAGEEARQANAESAEAMVLLRRADALEAEKNELIRLVAEREAAFDYAGALESLGKLIRKFPADHHAIRLAGQKRQSLAELTRLRGLGEQMVAAGRIADSLGTWQRVLQLRPDDPAAQEQARLGKRARTRRRLIGATTATATLALAAGGAWAVWTFTSVRDIPGLFGNPPAATGTASAEGGPIDGQTGIQEGTSRPTEINPLVRQPGSIATVGADEDGAAGDEAGALIEDRTIESVASAAAEAPAMTEAEAEAAEAIARADRASRDAASARSHAMAAGAPGLAAETFGIASERHERGQALFEAGDWLAATELLGAARGIYVSAAGAARAEIASIETLIASKRFRAAERSIDAIRGKAPGGVAEELVSAIDAGRGSSVEIAPGVAIDLRYIEPGAFEMGSDPDEPGRRATEDRRLVRIERPFWMMRTEFTHGMFAAIGGEAPDPSTADLPVTGLSLDDAKAIAAMLTERAPGVFSVPSEAQWEYACRADTEPSLGDGSTGQAAWWLGTSDARLMPVARLTPNAWGLLDMLGNAAELVIADDLGHGDQVTMTRGGSYLSPMSAVRPAARHELVPRDRGDARTGVRFIWHPDASADDLSSAQADGGEGS